MAFSKKKISVNQFQMKQMEPVELKPPTNASIRVSETWGNRTVHDALRNISERARTLKSKSVNNVSLDFH